MSDTPRVDRILEGWFGESLENMENEESARKNLYVPLRKIDTESALLTERLSLSQQDRHTLEVECRELRVQNDKLRRALENLLVIEETREAVERSPSSNEGIVVRQEWVSNRRAALVSARACLAAIEQKEG